MIESHKKLADGALTPKPSSESIQESRGFAEKLRLCSGSRGQRITQVRVKVRGGHCSGRHLLIGQCHATRTR